MTKFVIIIRAEAMLQRNARDAVIGTIDLMSSAQEAIRLLQARGMAATIQHLLENDAEPAPTPVRRTRKPRAALGSSPLATPQQDDAETMARQYEEIRNRKPPRFTPTTTGIDGLSPEAGADPGPIPEIMRK